MLAYVDTFVYFYYVLTFGPSFHLFQVCDTQTHRTMIWAATFLGSEKVTIII